MKRLCYNGLYRLYLIQIQRQRGISHLVNAANLFICDWRNIIFISESDCAEQKLFHDYK
jgi:hypothetical protein